MSFIEVVPDVLAKIYDCCDYSTQISFGHVCLVFRDVVIRRSADTRQCAECPDPFARERRTRDDTVISCSLACYHAAERNYFDLLKWLAGAGYSMKNGERICDCAISNGNYEMLVWAVENGCVWTQNNADRVVGKNRSDMFEYLVKTDGSRIGINFKIIFAAIRDGNTAVLQFAHHEVGYMFDSYTWHYPLDLTKCDKECLDLLLKMGYSTTRVMHHVMLKNRTDALIPIMLGAVSRMIWRPCGI